MHRGQEHRGDSERRDDRRREEYRRDDESRWDRPRFDQHERERSRYRRGDDYLHGHTHERGGAEQRYDSGPGGGANPRGGANDRARFDYRRDEEGPRHDRYEYGADEDRRQWGEPRPGDGEGYSRVEGPRRDESYRSPSESDISRTWRTFDSWGDTDYSRQRGQGFGWHRGDDYGDHWGSTNERSRDDH